MNKTFSMSDRSLVDSWEWEELVEKIGHNEDFENEEFSVCWWNDEDAEETPPNFIHKPTGFKIWWYKYPFRASDMNQELTKKQICKIFQKCIKSIKQ